MYIQTYIVPSRRYQVQARRRQTSRGIWMLVSIELASDFLIRKQSSHPLTELGAMRCNPRCLRFDIPACLRLDNASNRPTANTPGSISRSVSIFAGSHPPPKLLHPSVQIRNHPQPPSLLLHVLPTYIMQSNNPQPRLYPQNYIPARRIDD